MAAEDDFNEYKASLSSPAEDVDIITPDDDNDLTNVSRAILCAEAGTIEVVTLKGNTRTITVTAGQMLPLRVVRIRAANTTVTNISIFF